MIPTAPQTILIGTFPDSAAAERYVEALRQADFRDDQIGVATPGKDTPDTPVEDGALGGALTGGVVGVLAGLALAGGLIPGIGPVLAGGLLAGSLGGAAVGAAAGSLLGGLLALGVPEDQARTYEGHLRAGRTLVVVRAAGRYPDAMAILRRCEEEADPRLRAVPELEPLDELRGDGP